MPGIFRFVNAKCVKCKIIEEEMVRIGAFIMCSKCFAEEFTTEDPVKLEREKYLFWLKVWTEDQE